MQWVNGELRDVQTADQLLQPLLIAMRIIVKPNFVEEVSWPPMARHYLQDWDSLTVENEVTSEVSDQVQNIDKDDRKKRKNEVIVDRNDDISEQEQCPTSVTRRARRNRRTPRRLED